jgi:hypothetical protein
MSVSMAGLIFLPASFSLSGNPVLRAVQGLTS